MSRLESGEEPIDLEDNLPDAQLFSIQITDDYFANIIEFLVTGNAPAEYTEKQRKQLVVKAADFTTITGQLYKLGPYEKLRWYVLTHEQCLILQEAHAGITGGHYSGKPTTQKVLTAGLWWPTLHKYVMEFCKKCDVCQRIGKPSRRDEMLLNPQVSLQAFDKCTIYFVGPINPPGKNIGSRYIITTTNYLTRWVEVKSVKDSSASTAAQFIFENNITRFRCPRILMSDQGTHFLNQTIEHLTEEFQVFHQKVPHITLKLMV